MDLNKRFQESFEIGDFTVSEPGSYALCYLLQEPPKEKGHRISMLMNYAELMIKGRSKKPILQAFNVESIHSTCIACPYNQKKDIVNARNWLFLQPVSEWHKIFIQHLCEKFALNKIDI